MLLNHAWTDVMEQQRLFGRLPHDNPADRVHVQPPHQLCWGFIEAPNTIDWEYAFSNFDFTKNPTLFITEIMIAVFFIIVFVWARRWDKKDVEKLGVSPLPDNDPEHKYLYELVVTTGLRRNAGTESKVYFALSGARNDSGVRALDDTKRRILQRGCTNRFLLAVEKPLGDLNFMRLWHDNSGKGSAASWYCDTIVAIDLQTRLRYHFVVNRWFAVEEDDGFIDRVLPVAGPEELQQFGYMFSTHTKKDLTDGHLWLSIMARPPESRFTRVERVACCLLLLFLTMVTACMFYQKEGPTKSTSTALNVGPFSLTPRMIFVGVITNVITFVPLFIVMELFRRSRLHTGHVNQLLSAIDKHFEGARSQKSWHVTCDLEDQQETAEGQRAPHTASTGVTNQEITTAMLELREVQNSEENVSRTKCEAGEEGGDDEDKYAVKEGKGISARKSKTFPWWVRIFAWIIIVVGTTVSAFFTTMYGIQFGDETCKKWISSLFVSFFSSVMLSQPLKVVLMAVFMALLCKNKKGNEEEDFLAEEEEILSELGEKLGMRSSEEWLHELNSNEGDEQVRRTGVEPPTTELLQSAREKRLKEKKMYEIIREILFYVIFYMLLLAVTFSFRDPNAFTMKEQMMRLFIPAEDLLGTANIDGISTEDQFWTWLKQQMIPALRARPWYNGDPPLLQRGFTGDRVGRLVGYAILRQKRTQLDSCTVQPSMRFLYKHCVHGYSLANEETRSFGPKWEPLNASSLAASINSSKTDYAHEAFLYSTGADLKSLPYMALINTYSAGGYVFQMRGSEKIVQANIDTLRSMRWLDRQTRAVFVEFAFYNPNINLFGVGTVYFEYQGTGGMFGTYRFDAVNLLSFIGSSSKVMDIFCQVMFCITLLGFIIKELRNLYRMKRAYFYNLWNNLEVFILVGSLFSIAIYAYMLIETTKLTGEFAKYGGNVYLNFQYVTFLNEYLVYLTGSIIFASTLKFNRLLRFNRRVGMLGDVIRFSARDIRQFFLMFSIMFLAFIQSFHLLFLDRLYDYHTFLYCAEQLMQIALGKFRFLDLYVTEPIIGPLLFAAYTFFIIFILLNMFVAILNEAFAQVKEDVQKQQNEHEIIDFIVEKAIMLLRLNNTRFAQRYFGSSLTEAEYRPHSFDEQLNVILPDRIDHLLKYIENTYFDDVKKEVNRLLKEQAAKEAGTRPISQAGEGEKSSRQNQAEDYIVLPDTRFLLGTKDQNGFN
ncbi:hypothetical protein BOX15_Mlig028406g1 [Macrostomum lignano]|uniref:PLAT domain-containing protein n=1 Tax=Macrostomum lignano TaxID=282301 RepID=A0A267DIW1_9PLAT|nr:hypothetical protein BOX15_Mlig028406g1 [Macrostomum lignano]